jgi:hypothetical protein
MTNVRRALALTFALATAAFDGMLAFSQEPRSPTKPTNQGSAVEAHLGDESVLNVVLLHDQIDVATRFGRLSVPAKEIRRIEIGVRISPEKSRRIEQAIARLASNQFKQREAASEELLRLREAAYPALLKETKSTNPEVADRARKLVKTLRETVQPERLLPSPSDHVVTDTMTIVGRIELEAFKIKTPYFGEQTLSLGELKSLRWPAASHEAKLVVDAEKYAGQDEAWMDTKIDVKWGVKLRMSAEGVVDLWPIAPEVGVYVAGPEGMATTGAAVVVPGGRVANRVATRLRPGALLGRIGEGGKPFVVGAEFAQRADDDGRLYLRIAPSPWNNASAGSFSVRIDTDEG